MQQPTFEAPHGWRSDLIKLTVAAGILFFLSLGARDLWNPNEPIYGLAVAEMDARGDWLIPTINDRVFAEKPILYYWGALAASKLLGEVDELSLRVPSALAGLLSVLLTYLLVLPYAGRRRALLAAALFMTLYQVFWASRAVQMDVLVLASTLGVVVPLTRMMDFEARPTRAFALAGVAAGLGFAAKGPVSWVVAGTVVLAYAIATRRLHLFLRRPVLIGIATTLVVTAPWYVLLWLNGEQGVLYEVLIRQNFTRFVSAWDHQQPWWYFLKYLWIDYAPWAWLLPAAFLMRPRDEEERKLHRMSWLWIAGVIAFFSLSQSKRAPYILPVAPAVAILASGVVDRWIYGGRLERGARPAAIVAFSALAILFAAAGIGILVPVVEIPKTLSQVATTLGILLASAGLALGTGVVLARRRPALAPISLLGSMVALYLVASVWALPAVDPMKSARGFAVEMNRRLEATGGTVASFRFWSWRSGCAYYANRSIPNLESPEELEAFWQTQEAGHVLVKERHKAELRSLLPQAPIVLEGKIGDREIFLFGKAPRPEEEADRPEEQPGEPAAPRS